MKKNENFLKNSYNLELRNINEPCIHLFDICTYYGL